MIKSHEDLVNELKQAAVSISRNAESIIGTEKFLKSVSVTINIAFDSAVDVDVYRTFTPEPVVERE